MAMADKEIGSVLIAINSYVNPRTHLEPLLNIDQAFADYIEAFYSRLFFHVEVLVDFGCKDLEDKLESFAKKSVGSRIAVVFLCHGGLEDGAEYIFTNDAQPVLVVKIENFLHMNCRDKNKYLFFDACRSDASGDESTPRLVYKASVDKTFVVFSTLPFHKAYVGGSYSLWSYWFTRKIVNQMLLDNVVASVDDEIREKLGITNEGQVSEVLKLGTVENPNLRAIAAAENQGRTRALSVELGSFITQMQKIMTEYRQKLSAVPEATTLIGPIGTSLASSLPQGSAKISAVSVGHNHPPPTSTASISPKLPTVTMSEEPPKDGVFDSKSFMEVYKDDFEDIVPADKIARSLKIEKVIDDALCHQMVNSARSVAAEILFDHLYETAKQETILKLCKVMKKKSDGYPKMWDLADAMEKNKPYKP